MCKKMIKGSIRSFTSIMVALMMIMTLTGCGGGNGKSSEGTAEGTTTTQAQAESTTATESEVQSTDGPMAPYPEEIEMVFGATIDPNGEDHAKIKEKFGESIEDNRWTRLIKEKLNIKVKYKYLAGDSTYEDGLKLLMSANDLPDYFAVLNWLDYQQMSEAGILAEMGPIFQQYATPFLKSKIEDEGPEVVYAPLKVNGKIYGIPRRGPSTNGYTNLFVRQDWLDKLSLEFPKTMDDVRKVAEAFKNNDPDGNKVNDTVGLGISNNYLHDGLTGSHAALFWAFGSYPNIWVEDNGNLMYGTLMPQTKNVLKFLADLYNNNLIDREFATYDEWSKLGEQIVSGKCGMFYGHHWRAANGNDVKVGINPGIDAATVALKSAKHPEALVKIYNLIFEKIFGETAEYKYWEDGGFTFGRSGPLASLDPYVDLDAHSAMVDAVKNGTTDKLTGTAAGFYKNITEDKNDAVRIMFGWENSCFNYIWENYPGNVIWNAFYSRPTETQKTNWTSMEELIDTTFLKFIQGKEDIDSGFDALVNKWMEMGGSKITEEIKNEKSK